MGSLHRPIIALTALSAALSAVSTAHQFPDAPTCAQVAAATTPARHQLGSVVVMDCASKLAVTSASAVRVSSDQWVSAAHAIDGPESSTPWLVDAQGQAHLIDAYEQDAVNDLVLITQPSAAGKIRLIAPACRGGSVVAYSSDGRSRHLKVLDLAVDAPAVDSVLILHGQVQEQPTAPSATVLRLAGEIKPGFSGGPILDSAGRMVGMSYAYSDDDHSFAVTANELKLMLHKHARGR